MIKRTIILGVIDIICLLTSISLFMSYNSGKGGALGSLKKRCQLVAAILFFIAFIVTTNVLLGNTLQESVLELFNNLVFAFFVAFIAFVYKEKLII